jgi:hypothetical protein
MAHLGMPMDRGSKLYLDSGGQGKEEGVLLSDSIPQYSVVQYGTLVHKTVRAVQYSTVQYSAALTFLSRISWVVLVRLCSSTRTHWRRLCVVCGVCDVWIIGGEYGVWGRVWCSRDVCMCMSMCVCVCVCGKGGGGGG